MLNTELLYCLGLLLDASVPSGYLDDHPDTTGILVITDANHGERGNDGSYTANVADAYFDEMLSSPQYFAQLFEDAYRHDDESAGAGSALHLDQSEATFHDIDTQPLDDFTFTSAVRYNHTDDNDATTAGDDDNGETRVFEIETNVGDIEVVRNATDYILRVTPPGGDAPTTEVIVPGSTTGDWESVAVVRVNDTVSLIVVAEDGSSEQTTGDFTAGESSERVHFRL